MVRAQNTYAPGIIYEGLFLALRTIRDLAHIEIGHIWTDSKEVFEHIQNSCKQFIPDLLSCLKYYPEHDLILDLYSIEDEVSKTLEKKVNLKSGWVSNH